MHSFRTEINLDSTEVLIHHQTPVLAMGSCFATHLGQKLRERKFPILTNPFGILYHPVSIASSLHRILDGQEYHAEDLIFHQGLWHSLDHHSHYSHPEPEWVLEKINSHLRAAKKQIMTSGVLLLTLGTARVFEHLESNKPVANCHKMPAKEFRSFRLNVPAIVSALVEVLSRIQQQVPDIQCLLTVSPVRHIKDGLVENQRSKAVLLLAAEEVTEQLPWVNYFPAYEMVLDDLRDYRFYENDMIHPNSQAIDYIWDKFSTQFFSPATRQLNKEIEKMLQASLHRPFHPELPEHQQFLRQQLEKLEQLEQKFPFLNFSAERRIFSRQQ